LIFYNNIFYSLADTDYDSYLNSSVIMDNNCYFGPNRPNIKVTDSNGIFADPMFTSPGSALSDGTEIRNLAELCKGYMLKDGSPLVRAGKTITTDSIMKMFPNANRSLLESADLGIDFFGNPLRKDSPAIGVYEPVPVN